MKALTEPITLSLKSLRFTDEEFYQFCIDNEQFKFERDAQGNIIIMANTGGSTGRRNAEIIFQLSAWNRANRVGEVFDSSTAFRLPNGAVRSPDAAWVRKEQWEALGEKEKNQFPPLCPDFVIELLSVSDDMNTAQEKMKEWIANGATLAWLINPYAQEVHIYRHGKKVETLSGFDRKLSGEGLLKEFMMDLSLLV